MRKIIHNPAQPPSTFQSSLDKDLDSICMKCLEKEPAHRYLGARALAEDLDRWLHGKPVLARPVGNLGRLVRWCRHEPAIAFLTASVFILLVLTTLLAFWLFAKERGGKEAELEVGRILQSVLFQKIQSLNESNGPSQVSIYAEERDLLPRSSPPPLIFRPNPTRLTLGVHLDQGSAAGSVKYDAACTIMEYLETHVADPPLLFDLVIFRGHQQTVNALITEQVDIMAGNTLTYAIARQKNSNLKLLAQEHRRGGGTVLQGAIFGLNCDVNDIQDLRNKAFFLGNPSSALTHVIPQALLYEAGLKINHLSRWSDSGREFRWASRNNYDAGVTLSTKLEGIRCHVMLNFNCPTDPWIATSRLSDKAAQAIQKCLLELQDPNVLGRMHPDLIGFDETCPEVYDFLEECIVKAALFRGESP